MPRQAGGLTLFELLIALAILSLLASLSLPNLRDIAQAVTGDVTLRRLANAVQLGRSAAITRGQSVTLCRSVDGMNCGGNWRDGVVVFTDANRNRQIDEEDALLRFITFPDSGGSIRFRAFQNRQYLQLTSLGFTHNQNGNFSYCPNGGDRRFARQLVLNRTARLRFAQDGDGDGIREDSRGRPLSCE